MDLQQWESFLAVARRQSFTRAARDLNLTQPGVSRRVQGLERELGVILLARRRGRLELTPAGERFRVFAEETLDRYHRLAQDLRGAPTTLEGDLRIAASTTPGEFLVPRLVARFTERHPGVRPEVFITDSAEVVAEVREGRWDLGFVGAHIARRGLRYQAVAQDEIVLAVPASHPFAGRREVRLADLADQPFLDREGGSGTLLSVRSALAQHGLALPPHRVVMVLNTTQAIVSAVESRYGLGWVSSLALEDRNPQRVAAVRLSEVPLRRSLYLVYSREHALSPVAMAFIASVLEEARRGALASLGEPLRSP